MNTVIHFELASPDPEKEVAFFQSLFGWEAQRWGEEEYWLVDTGRGEHEPGINGAIMPLGMPDQPRVVNTVSVDDLDASLASATAAGATVAMEKQEVPNVGWVAYVVSPTGIVFGMLQPVPGSTPE